MTRYAYVEFGRVESFIDVPEGSSIEDYPREISAHSFECEDEVEIGWYLVGNTFQSPEAPRYKFQVLPLYGSIFPGSTLQLVLTTENVEDNTAFSYTVTGLEETHLSEGTLSGNIVVSSNVGEVELTINPDLQITTDKSFDIKLEDINQSATILITVPPNLIEE